jgi:hypothetical protein
MPKTITLSPMLRAVIEAQDGVATKAQVVAHGVGRGAITHRTQRGSWRWLLPGVILTTAGYPTIRQRLVAAWLWAGPDSAIDGLSACYWYGLGQQAPTKVHIVVPWDSPARTASFVVVRRAVSDILIGGRALVPYVDAPTALVVAARNASSERAAIALLSRGLQVGLVREDDLFVARERIGDKWCAQTDTALVAVGVGVRSPAERDARDLILSSRRVPQPRWNQWVDVGDGKPPVCLDALWEDAAVVHETNGKRYHAWDLTFEDMQARHDRLTAAGLVVLHNTPTRIRRSGPDVLRDIERTYALYRGRGLPASVRLIDPPGWSIAATAG